MPSRRWWIALLLFAATLLNYLDRQVLALVTPVLRQELSLTATGYSHILTAFLFGYTFSQLFVGRVIDRVGPRRSLIIAMIWWSAAGIAAATSRNTWQLGLFLFLMGIGEAASWPGSVKAIQEWFSAKQRAVAVGFFNSGSSAGAVLAPLVVTYLTIRYSWRMAFIACGCLGFVWLIPWMFLYPASRPNVGETASETSLPAPISSATLFRDPRTWGVILARFFGDSIWVFYIFWLPDYLSRVRHMSLSSIGATAWIPFVAAGIGNMVGGMLSGMFVRKGLPAARSRILVMAGSAIAMTSGVGVWFCSTPALAIALISFVVFAYSSWAANVLTVPSDVFPQNAVATVVGFSGAAGGFGTMLSMLLAGHIIDHYSYLPVFIGLALLPVFASTCSFLTLSSGKKSSLKNSGWRVDA
ncbi:MAG: MFS transporter [Edaphobacter sp.]